MYSTWGPWVVSGFLWRRQGSDYPPSFFSFALAMPCSSQSLAILIRVHFIADFPDSGALNARLLLHTGRLINRGEWLCVLSSNFAPILAASIFLELFSEHFMLAA